MLPRGVRIAFLIVVLVAFEIQTSLSQINRASFPKGFVFGTASSAFQVCAISFNWLNLLLSSWKCQWSMHIFSLLCFLWIKKESPYTFRGKENIIENVCVFFWSSKLNITKLTHRCLKQALPMTLSWWLFFVFRKWLTTGYWKKCICLELSKLCHFLVTY